MKITAVLACAHSIPFERLSSGGTLLVGHEQPYACPECGPQTVHAVVVERGEWQHEAMQFFDDIGQQPRD